MKTLTASFTVSFALLILANSSFAAKPAGWECVDDSKAKINCQASGLDPDTNEVLMDCKTKDGEISVLMGKGNAQLPYIQNDRARAKQKFFDSYRISGTYPLGFGDTGKNRQLEAGVILCNPKKL